MKQYDNLSSNRSRLQLLKIQKKDEFYTELADVIKELAPFLPLLKNKKILLPCDGENSAFTLFFKKFQKQFHYKLSFSTYFKGVGVKWQSYNFADYDFVFTNPPFSDFIPLYDALLKSGVKFSIIGSIISASYINVFDSLKKGTSWLGVNRVSKFLTPDGNYKVVSTNWYTNLPVPPKKDFKFFANYSNKCFAVHNKKNEVLSNYTWIAAIKDLPFNYPYKIAVPITIFEYNYHPYFKIIEKFNGSTLLVNRFYNSKTNYSFIRVVIKNKLLNPRQH